MLKRDAGRELRLTRHGGKVEGIRNSVKRRKNGDGRDRSGNIQFIGGGVA